MRANFEIGPLCLGITTPVDFPWTKEVETFRIDESEEVQIEYNIDFMESFLPVWGTVLYRDSSMMVMRDQNYEYRIYYLPGGGEPYVMAQHLDENHVQIFIDKRAMHLLKWDRNLMSFCAFEHFLLRENAFLLHASYIIYNGKAIVFTAPSGTGKSTQADLWAMYEGAEVINGDRTVLMHADGEWYACGFPVCGSSEFCLNETVKLEAVICLGQAKKNQARKLRPVEALRNVYSQTFVNNWDKRDGNLSLDLVSRLIIDIPVWEYVCTKEKDAVEYLKGILFAE